MTVRVAINGFGRMGRLALRDGLRRRMFGSAMPYEIVQINEPAGDVVAAAHLLQFDSVHGALAGTLGQVEVHDGGEPAMTIAGQRIAYTSEPALTETTASELYGGGIDLVIEASGVHRTPASLAPYYSAGVRKVVVSAPVAGSSVVEEVAEEEGPLNIVYGVNEALYEPDKHHLVTAASCTTNAIAPVICVLRERFGIKRGAFTSIHALTNTQRVLDGFHRDLRRARSSATSLIPTTTGSATAIFEIYPDLRGKLDGIAVRVPIAQASIADCTFELERAVTTESVNAAFAEAAGAQLRGVLGVEARPLVSIDYEGESRSVVIDALSTRVVDGAMLKVLGWYDNETGYVARMMDLVARVASNL